MSLYFMNVFSRGKNADLDHIIHDIFKNAEW